MYGKSRGSALRARPRVLVAAWLGALVVLAGAVGLRSSSADEGSYALDFLSVGVGARALGMGGAHVADAHDATAAYWNPAGLTAIASHGFSAQHADMFQSGDGFALSRGLAQYNFLNVVLPFQSNAKVAVSWIRLSVDDIPRVTFTDRNGDGVLGTYRDLNANGKKDPDEFYVDTPLVAETFSNSDNAFLFSYARPVREDLSVGASVKAIRQTSWNASSTGFGLDLGATYRPVTPVGIAIVVQDAFGTRVRWNTSSRASFTRDASARIGIAARLPYRNLVSLGAAVDVDLGRAMQRSEEDGDSRTHLGAELTLLRTVSFRLGLDAGEFTAGAGFRVPMEDMQFFADYAFMTHPDLGDAQRLSLTGTF